MREMKDSGVEWIDEIPSNWSLMPLKSFVTFGKGLPITKDNLVEDGVAVVSYGQIHSKSNPGSHLVDELVRYVSEEYIETNSNCLAIKGDIFVADTSEDYEGIGNAVHIDWDKEVFAGYHTVIIRPINRKYSRYLSYLFMTDAWRNQLRSRASGIKVYSVTQGLLKKTAIIVPDENCLNNITDYLDSKCRQIDLIISKQRAIIEKLEEYKQSVITEAVTRGINHSCMLKDSGYKWIGEIPVHWEMVYAKQLFTQRKDRAFEDDEQLTASQKYGIISQNAFMEMEGRQVMQVIKGEEILKHVGKGDFVISMRSFQGGLEYSEISGKISSAYVMLIPNHDLVYDRYYKWLFKCNRYITALQGTSNLIRDGQALRYSNFTQVYLPVLPMDEQKEIADYLDRVCPKIDEEISKREEFLDKIQEYKKSLIYEVVTGKKEI